MIEDQSSWVIENNNFYNIPRYRFCWKINLCTQCFKKCKRWHRDCQNVFKNMIDLPEGNGSGPHNDLAWTVNWGMLFVRTFILHLTKNLTLHSKRSLSLSLYLTVLFLSFSPISYLIVSFNMGLFLLNIFRTFGRKNLQNSAIARLVLLG